MRERLKFEREIRDLGLDATPRLAEIGGFGRHYWRPVAILHVVRCSCWRIPAWRAGTDVDKPRKILRRA